MRHVDIDILEWGSNERSLTVLSPRAHNSHVRRMVVALREKKPRHRRQLLSFDGEAADRTSVRRMKILVVGGAGYIGSICADFCSTKATPSAIFDNLTEGHRRAGGSSGAQFIEGDLIESARIKLPPLCDDLGRMR